MKSKITNQNYGLMRNVDHLMAQCPLKHEIRTTLWKSYIQGLGAKPIKYLTLYSPPLMDVKFLHKMGFISVTNSKYDNVVGVSLDEKAVADTNSQTEHRLELLLEGDINSLLSNADKSIENKKKLFESFPFDVINLDYTDTLHASNKTEELSPHFSAIENLLRLQYKKNKDEFILFITAYAKVDLYNKYFLGDLVKFVKENISHTPNFSSKLNSTFKTKDANEFKKADPNNFFLIGLIKFILRFLKPFNYDIKSGEANWLIRNRQPYESRLLHLAFHIQKYVPAVPKKRTYVGKNVNFVEHKSVRFIRNNFLTLEEKKDYDRLFKLHQNEINELNSMTFELRTPAPKE